MLFENKPRTRMEPMLQGEGDYAFYDSCGRPGYDEYRALLNEWVSELPSADRDELIARFRKNDPLQYRAALAELVTHAALLREGYDVEIHPVSAHRSHRPDFMARSKDGASIALVEVTTFGPSQEDTARSNRESAIYNAIDATPLPAGYRLTYDVVSYGSTSPNTRKLCREISAWAHAYASTGAVERIERIFDALDWQIEIGVAGGFRDSSDGRMIVAAMGEARWVAGDLEIRDALEKKGTRYGNNDIPYLIVVADCRGELTGGDSNDEEFLEALYGTVTYTVSRDPEAEPRVLGVSRSSNGYWGTPDAPRNPQVSGVLLLPQPDLWSLRSDNWQPLLARNRRAAFPLPAEFLPLPGYRLTPENRFEREKGKSLADILGLPTPWPPNLA